MREVRSLSRRNFFAAGAAALFGATASATDQRRAQIAITLDLEMSAHYPQRGMTEWNFRKGDLDAATKAYAIEAAKIVKDRGGRIHFFCVGQVLEQPDVSWLKDLAAEGHPVGNHTYDHVNVLATKPEDLQFRFQRAPWLIRGKTTEEVIRENIRMTTNGLRERCAITPAGFRTPGGFGNGLRDRSDIQKLLLGEGFTWVSSLYPPHPMGKAKEVPGQAVFDGIVEAQKKAQPFAYPTGLIEVPMSPVSDVNAFRSNYWKLEWFLKAIERSVTWCIDNGAVFDFLAHPSCLVVEDPKFESIKLICDLTMAAGDKSAFVDLGAIARRVKTK